MVQQSPLILVAEDQPALRRLIEDVLRAAGYRVTAAAHGEQALQLAAAHKPDLALLDWQMPGMDGLETLRRLRERLPTLPVLVMTAAAAPGDAGEWRALGARLLSKPFDIHQLQGCVQQLLAASPPA